MADKPNSARIESRPIRDTHANPLWGGRFGDAPDGIMVAINASIDVDSRLYREDIAASRAHLAMLEAVGVVTASDGAAILAGLDTIEQEIESGSFRIDPALEDIHMHIEARLAELIGPAAGRLHTARSRNDQVATDFRLWLRRAVDDLDIALVSLQEALIDQAEQHYATLMPGYTHLQPAQPVTFGHHLLAYVEMIGRDRGRLSDARRRMNECPLGAAALAGTGFAIDRWMTARALEFDRPCANSIDAVADRDFALEFLAAASLIALHLSRLGEEIVLWNNPCFGFIRLSDRFSTGSSIMPQKRNPDAAELIRAKVGAITGGFVGLVMVMKGLPLAYSKDMQEDKAPVFRVFDDLVLCVAAMDGMMRDASAVPDRMRQAAEQGYLTATDLADWLVRRKDVPFREAHALVGRLVGVAAQDGRALSDLTAPERGAIDPILADDEVETVLQVAHSLANRNSLGGTAPDRVIQAVRDARRRFLPERAHDNQQDAD